MAAPRSYDCSQYLHSLQDLELGTLVLLRNSVRDGRKGDKLNKRWLGPYKVEEVLGKGVYQLTNPNTGRVLKKAVNGCRYIKTMCAKVQDLSASLFLDMVRASMVRASMVRASPSGSSSWLWCSQVLRTGG